jgi:hypothetical protein
VFYFNWPLAQLPFLLIPFSSQEALRTQARACAICFAGSGYPETSEQKGSIGVQSVPYRIADEWPDQFDGLFRSGCHPSPFGTDAG